MRIIAWGLTVVFIACAYTSAALLSLAPMLPGVLALLAAIILFGILESRRILDTGTRKVEPMASDYVVKLYRGGGSTVLACGPEPDMDTIAGALNEQYQTDEYKVERFNPNFPN